MALEYEFCERQICRMGGLKFAPSSQDALREVVLFLQRAAFSENHAVRIVDHYLANEQDFPTPAGLKLYASTVPTDAADEKLPAEGCDLCDHGWRPFTRMVSPGGVEPYLAEYRGFCSCPAGQWRKKAVRAYEAQERAKRGIA